MPITRRQPQRDELWLSRPPYMLMAHVTGTTEEGEPRVSYELLDDDGRVLAGPFDEPLDNSWWQNFQPLDRRFG